MRVTTQRGFQVHRHLLDQTSSICTRRQYRRSLNDRGVADDPNRSTAIAVAVIVGTSAFLSLSDVAVGAGGRTVAHHAAAISFADVQRDVNLLSVASTDGGLHGLAS